MFCFLCIKGSLNQKNECALCRSKIDENYLQNPKLYKENEKNKKRLSKKSDETVTQEQQEYAWFYKGNQGWWKYDDRTAMEIEQQFTKKILKFNILIAGNMYEIDLVNNQQSRTDNPSRKREIKRDLIDSLESIKGVAGILHKPITKRTSNRKNKKK